MLNSNTLKPNQIFKNYKELCSYLGEEIKAGCSKQAQIKEWERYFSYKKEGNKFIITEVFDSPKDKIDNRGGNNLKNVKPMLDYLMSEFNPKYVDQYCTISNWSTMILHLLNKEMCDITYQNEDEMLKYCEEKQISDVKLFKEYVGSVKFITKNLITTAFRVLQRQGYLTFNQGYKFRYENKGHTNCVSTDILNDCIDQMEREICEILLKEDYSDTKIKGKQLVYILHHSKDKENLEKYKNMCINRLNDDEWVCDMISEAISCRDDITGHTTNEFVDGSEQYRLLQYYKAFKITSIDTYYPKTNNKQEVIDVIKRLAMKHMMSIQYTTKWGEIIEPYNNEKSLNEIEKINKILFTFNSKLASVSEIQKEYGSEKEEQIMFFIELDPDVAELGCAS